MVELLLEQAAHWHIYAGIMLFLVLTGAGLPIPEEIPIVWAGVLSSGPNPELYPPFAFVACLLGALAGDTLMYCIGRFLGRPFLSKYSFFNRLVPVEREQKMEQLIRDHGLKVFFVARFMIGVRAPMYFAAGMTRVPWRVFIVIDAICASIVVGVVFLLSMIYGDDIAGIVKEYQLGFTVIVIVVVLVAMLVWYIRHRRRPADDSEVDDEGEASGEQAEPDEREGDHSEEESRAAG